MKLIKKKNLHIKKLHKMLEVAGKTMAVMVRGYPAVILGLPH